MAHQDGRSDAYLEAHAAALSWLRARDIDNFPTRVLFFRHSHFGSPDPS